MYSAVCRSKMDYGCQLYSTASLGRLKKNLVAYTEKCEGIRIYTDAFRISPVETLHAEVCDPNMDLKSNELEIRFLYTPSVQIPWMIERTKTM